MSPKTYAQILDDVETLLQDAGVDPSPPAANSVFATAEIDAFMPSGLVTISYARPWQYKRTRTTTADSYDITLSAGDKWRLLEGSGYKGTGIVKVEYEVDQDPRDFRGLTRFGDVISLELDVVPDSADSVYLYMNKIHLLQKQLGTADTAGAIKTLAAVGAVSLALKSLGTGTIDEMSTLAIAGDSTVYYVISQATIAANEATVSIWPPLTAAAAVDAVVTLSLTESTLDMVLESYLARLLAAMACISKSTKSYAQVNTAITTIANAATAIAAIAARITQAVADAVSGRAQAALGATAVTLANVEFDLMNTEVDLAKTALSSGNDLLNTVTIGGGAAEYMGQATSDVGVAQGYLLTGQSYLQEASADHANAAQYFSAAAAELRGASEKANEAVANLRLVATRLQVSQGGMRYEEWGRRELALVQKDLLALSGYPSFKRFPRD